MAERKMMEGRELGEEEGDKREGVIQGGFCFLFNFLSSSPDTLYPCIVCHSHLNLPSKFCGMIGAVTQM